MQRRGERTLQRRALEELARRAARRSLTAFKRLVWPRYTHAPHLEALDRVLMACSRHARTGGAEGLSHVIVMMPPRHGKTQTVSRLYPAWHLGNCPDHRVILASYGATLAHKSSRYARNVLRTPRYRAVFPGVLLADDSQAVDAWNLAGRDGGMDAMGVGGGVTGKGGHIIIVDDPIKSREEAESETYREKVWDWFNDDLYTRREPGAAVIVIMTRWHHDDLVGRLLREDPDLWTVIRLPALAEEGDPLGREPGAALWPQRFPAAALAAIRQRLGSHSWNALYQQRPTAREGNMIRRAWLSNFVDVAPRAARRVRYWDKAGTAGGGAYTAGVLLALDEEGIVYVEDVVRGQWSAGERERVIRQTAELDAQRYGHVVIWVEQEPGSGGLESVQATIRNLAGFPVYADRPTGDKDARLEPFAAQAEAGNVRLLRGAWNAAYVEELAAVPNGACRDQADATAGAFNRLAGGPTWEAVIV